MKTKSARDKATYDRLRAADPEAFRRCVEHASGIALNHDLDVQVAYSIERVLVSEVLRTLEESDEQAR